MDEDTSQPVGVTVVVLVGPKGSGKSTVGRSVATAFGGTFIEVEATAKRVLERSGGVIDEAYAKRAFEAIAAEIDAAAERASWVVFETTGASAETGGFLERLGRRHRLRLVRLRARAETCAARIAARDPTRQIAVDDALVRQMHAASERFEAAWDLDLDNDSPLGPGALVEAFRPLLTDARPRPRR